MHSCTQLLGGGQKHSRAGQTAGRHSSLSSLGASLSRWHLTSSSMAAGFQESGMDSQGPAQNYMVLFPAHSVCQSRLQSSLMLQEE